MVEIQTRQRVDGRGLALFEFDLWMRIICKTKYHHHLQSGFNLGHLYSERELMKIDVSPFLKFLWHLDQYSSLQATWACQNKLRNGQHILKRSIIKNPFLCIPKHIYEEKKSFFLWFSFNFKWCTFDCLFSPGVIDGIIQSTTSYFPVRDVTWVSLWAEVWLGFWWRSERLSSSKTVKNIRGVQWCQDQRWWEI